ncbi:MAG: ATP-binding protein [Myxococcales bacterium]|nr:ATP-binding protein [Myxococcales bacterium]
MAEAEERRRQTAVEGSVSRSLKATLSTGLRSVVELADDQILAKLDARLRRPALELDPALDGGRLICGPTGVGKSLALALVLRRVMRVEAAQRYDAADDYGRDALALVVSDYVWARAQDLPVARLQTRLGDGEAELIANAKRADVLVLDDLGWESQRANAADVVLEVIATRYDAGKPTLVTSGLTLADLTERYGAAVVRRICETGGLPGRVLDLWAPEARA